MALVLCAIADGLARLTLDRPEKLNALSFEEIDAHLDTIASEGARYELEHSEGRGP